MFLDFDINNFQRSILYDLFHILEIFIDVIALIGLSVCLRVFIISPQFHVHLITLMINTAIQAYTINFNRLIMIIISLLYPKEEWNSNSVLCTLIKCFDLIHFTSCIIVISSFPTIICERFIATIFLSKYEHRRCWGKLAIVIILQYIIGFVLTWALYKGWIPMIPSLLLGILITAFAVTAFVLLNRINHRRYQKSKNVGTTYTLTERYQLAENIRTAQIMKNCCFLASFLNTIGAAIVCALYLFRDKEVLPHIFFALFNLTTVAYSILFPVAGMYSHEVWKNNFILTLQRIIPCKRLLYKVNDAESQENPLRNTDGSRMSFSVDEQRNYYFNSLISSWN